MLSRCLTDWSPWRPKGKELPEPFLRAVGVGFRRSVDYESAIDTVWNYSPAVWALIRGRLIVESYVRVKA